MAIREKWSWELGLIFGALGSAVGLGNIWLFPMLVGANGGAAFLIPYLLTVYLLSWVGLTIEFNVGRITQAGPSKAYERLGLPLGKYLGVIPVIRTFLVFAWYSTVTGWSLRYIFATLDPVFWSDPATFYRTVSTTWQSPLFTAISVVLTGIIVMFGIRKGIEPAVKWMMITLFGILLILVVRGVTLPGAFEGLKFYLMPDFSKITPKVALNAMTQAFFSASLAGGAMVVYGSYIGRDEDTVASAITTAFGDTTVAVLAGFMVLSTAFAFGIAPGTGAGLLFISMPKAFAQMIGSSFFATLFFILAFFAAITSTVSMLEVATEAMLQYTRLSRKKAALILTVLALSLAVPISLYSVIWQYATYIVLYSGPLVAILPPIALFWVYRADKALEEINRGALIKLGRWFIYWGKYLYPVAILAAYIFNITG